MTPENEDLLRRLAVIDEGVLESLFGIVLGGHEPEEPDAKTAALVRLAGLVALDSAAASYHWSVTAALAAGASDDEVVGVLVPWRRSWARRGWPPRPRGRTGHRL